MTFKPLADPAEGTDPASTRRATGSPFPLRTLVASVALACSALVGQSAHALALGRVSVQSALGEPLRAEIDVPDINTEEASSLRATVAQPEVFKRAGLEYNPLLTGAQISMQRRPNGRVYLLLTSDRIVNDPFLDVILEANWSAGRIVRDYTMLLDPPATRQQQQQAAAAMAAPIAPTAPVVPPVSNTGEQRPAQVIQAQIAPSAARPAPVRAAPAPAPVAPVAVKAAPAPKPAEAAAPAQAGGQRVTVRPGDTATRIAMSKKPVKVSLDQMLIGMLQNNPDAFIAGNINRLKAGVVLDMPTSSQLEGISESQANQEVLAQSRDFDEFRRRLASGAPMLPTDASKRAASGKVQAQVEDKKPGATAADKLSLQKPTITTKSEPTAQDRLAADMAAKAAAARVAELNKNIADLKNAASASASASPAPAPSRAPVPKASEPLPTTIAVAAPPAPVVSQPVAPAPEPVVSQPAPVASEPVAAPTPTVVASAPVASPPPPAPVAETPGFVSELLDNPMVPAAAGGLVALLGGLAFYRVRQRKKAGQVDSSFMESRLQPDSFFGASGGQKVDTAEGETGNSSLAYSPSQLDAAGDVDPVAEADVYLAYGRDLQAEEILKEAVRTNPSRAAIHFKLLQIYAKRRDVKAYIAVAHDAYKLSRGLGPEWANAAEVGRELDPTHPLFMAEGNGDSQDGARDVAAIHAATQPLPLPPEGSAPETSFTATDMMPAGSLSHATSTAPLDLDLDLDFSDSLGKPGDMNVGAVQDNQAPLPDLTLPADIDSPPIASLSSNPQDGHISLDLDAPAGQLPSLPDFDQHATANLPLERAHAPSEPAPLEFDLGGLSLDLDPPSASATPPVEPAPTPKPPVSAPATLDSVFGDSTGPDSRGGDVSAEDALATKLALAEEFQAIGDDDGARTLAQEVADAATGNLKAKAQRFLTELG